MAGSITGIKAGKAFVLIEAVDATGKVLNTVRGRLGKFGTELSNIGRTMALRAIGALTPVALAVRTGTAYDDIMRKVEARSEGTAREMGLLREQTLKLGRAFGLLPSSMGAMQNIFAQAGFNRKQISSIVPAVALLARAGGEAAGSMEDTENAAKATSAVLRGFELTADDTAMVTGKLGIAINASNFTLEDITTSLQYAVPAAKLFNIGLDEMLAMLGAMRDLQIDPSIAGSAFKNFGLYLSQKKQREDFNKDLKAMTGNTVSFVDELGNLRSPLVTLPALLKATEGLGTAAQSDLLSGLLKTRATIPGAAVGRSTGRLAELLEQLKHWEGYNAKVQKHMDAGLGGAFRRFTATLEEAAIKLQGVLTPALDTATANLDKLLKLLSDWVAVNPGLVSGTVAFAVGMLGLGTALVIAGQATIALSALFGLGAFLASATAYLLAFVAPWALAAAGIYLAEKALEDFHGEASSMTKGLALLDSTARSTFASLATAAKTFTTTFRDDWAKTIKSVMDSLAGGHLDTAFKTLSLQLQVTWSDLVNSLMTKWDEFQDYTGKMRSGSYAITYREADLELLRQAQRLGLPAPRGQNYKDMIARQQELINHTRETVEGMHEDKPEVAARRAAKAERDSKLISLRSSIELARHNAAVDVELDKFRKHLVDLGATTPTTDATAKRDALEAAAAGLIGPGEIARSIPKGANEAVDFRSGESMKAFMEAKFNAYGDDALKVAEESRDALLEIRRKMDEGVGVL